MPRYVTIKAEVGALGAGGSSRMRRFSVADSAAVNYQGMKVYLLRVASMVAKGQGKLELGWKSPRGSVDSKRIDESTPTLAEMASPGSVFEGQWRDRLHGDRGKLFQAANLYAESLLTRHREYAERLGLDRLTASLTSLQKQVSEAGNRACFLSIGWGGGLANKVGYGDLAGETYRSIMRRVPMYQRSIQTGMPFPKTRRVIFEQGQPASLPGLNAFT